MTDSLGVRLGVAMAVVGLASGPACSGAATHAAGVPACLGGTCPDAQADANGSTASDASTEIPDTGIMDAGPPRPLDFDAGVAFDLTTCAQHAVYFDAAHHDTYSWTQSPGGPIVGTSSTPDMVNAHAYCDFTLPSGTSNLEIQFQGANVTVDPAMAFPTAGGGGLGIFVYAGPNAPTDSTTWGNYGTTAFTKYFTQRADWNRDLPAETWTVPIAGGVTHIYLSLVMFDAWAAIPMSVNVVGVTLQPM